MSNLDEMLDDVGLCFPYSRRDMLAMPMPAILRIHARAVAHLRFIYRTPPGG